MTKRYIHALNLRPQTKELDELQIGDAVAIQNQKGTLPRQVDVSHLGTGNFSRRSCNLLVILIYLFTNISTG